MQDFLEIIVVILLVLILIRLEYIGDKIDMANNSLEC